MALRSTDLRRTASLLVIPEHSAALVMGVTREASRHAADRALGETFTAEGSMEVSMEVGVTGNAVFHYHQRI
jgi:hypothetical protein